MDRANPARMSNATETIAGSTTVQMIAGPSINPAPTSAGLAGLKDFGGRTAVVQVLSAAKVRGATVQPVQMVRADPWIQRGINGLVMIAVKVEAADTHAGRAGCRCPADLRDGETRTII